MTARIIKIKQSLMNKEVQFRSIFRFTSKITDLFPVAGGQILDTTVKFFFGNKLLLSQTARETGRRLKRVKKFNKVLFVADLNIGDAVIALSGVSALREIFPGAEIDLVVKKSTGCLIEGNPDISNLYPLYVGAPFPVESDRAELVRLAGSKEYDLIINFSPTLEDKIFGKRNVINFSTMAVELVRNEWTGESVNNVTFQSHKFVERAFRDFIPPAFGEDFKGARIFLSENAINEAHSFLAAHEVSREKPIVLFNPDASARFTRMPFPFQLRLLQKLIDLQCTVLLGPGFVEKFIEHELVHSLPPDKKQKVIVVPTSFKIDAFGALLDMSDVFITGDTGPVHVAAARKFSRVNGTSLRNRTAVFTVFGGTPPRIYGYDSRKPGFFPAMQNPQAPACIAGRTCRNITSFK